MISLGDLRRKLAGQSGRASAWALADQAVASAGNFLTFAVLARILEPDAFGRFALVFGAIAVLNNVHSGLVVYPLIMDAANADGHRLRKTCAGALFTTAVLAPLQMAIVAGACWYANVAAAVPMVALLAWQGQETLRRTFTSHFLYAKALPGDVVSYVGQVAVLVVLSRTAVVTFDAAFASIAATSITAAIIQALQLRPRLQRLSILWQTTRKFIQTGRWTVVTHTLGMATPQVFLWTIAVHSGAAAGAAFQALASVITAINPIMFSTGNLIIPAAARGLAETDIRGAMHAGLRYAAPGAVLIIPYIAILVLAPGVVLTTIYGAASPYSQLHSGLRLFAVYGCLAYVAHVLGSFLYGIDKSRLVFKAHAASAVLVLAGIPVTIFGGLEGAIVGFTGTVMVRLAAHVYDLHSLMQTPNVLTPACTIAIGE